MAGLHSNAVGPGRLFSARLCGDWRASWGEVQLQPQRGGRALWRCLPAVSLGPSLDRRLSDNTQEVGRGAIQLRFGAYVLQSPGLVGRSVLIKLI